MSAPGMWWGQDPDKGLLHAVATSDVQGARERGWTEALCGCRLPVDVGLLSEPDDRQECMACQLGATADLAETGIELPPLAPFERQP